MIGNNGNSYILLNLITTKEFFVTFYFDANRVNPQSVVAHDSNEFIVESVLKHEENLKQKKSLLFKVRWLDYDASHDTCEPWKNLHSIDEFYS